MAGARPAVVPFADAAAWLRSPFALEELALGSVPLLAVRLPADRTGWDDRPEDLIELLTSARAVTVGIVEADVAPANESVAEAFDILLSTRDMGIAVVTTSDVGATLDLLAAAVAANPQAAVAMAQLLRLRAFESVPDGLLLESLTYSTLQAGPEFATWLAERGPATVPPDDEPPVLAERAGTALHVTLNRPRRANAVTASLRDLLVEQLRVAASDPSIDGVVLRGSGPSFCSGGDLAEFGSLPDPATAHATRLTRSPAWWVHRLARTTRVHLHGACIGAGIEVPAFAGTILAAADTRIRLPEVAMGLVPGAGGTCGIPRRIGRQRTNYLAITGAEIDATTALGWGLVDRIE